jgi:hypothetical protein
MLLARDKGRFVVVGLVLASFWAACPGKSFRATAAVRSSPARCSSLPPERPSHNGWAQARMKLAPDGASAIRLCRYAYKNNPRGTDGDQLVFAGLVPDADVARLVHDFDAVRQAKPRSGFTSCFFDAAPVVAHIAYPSGRAVTIYVRMDDCWFATNGDLRRSAGGYAQRRLRGELLHLTRS